jgi:hypothetical protein
VRQEGGFFVPTQLASLTFNHILKPQDAEAHKASNDRMKESTKRKVNPGSVLWQWAAEDSCIA